MKKAAWLFGCCLALPLSAQSFEPDLFTGRQNGQSFSATPPPGTPYMSSRGALFHFKALVAIGAGVEYRSESLKGLEASTTYGRPWVRFNVGYAFPAPLLKPFVGLEADFPLTSQGYGPATDALKRVAPRSQIGLYGGIRF